MSALAVHFKCLREVGGEGECTIVCKPSKDQPYKHMTRYEDIKATVSLIIPVKFVNQDLLCDVTGVSKIPNMQSIGTPGEFNTLIDTLSKEAFGNAVVMATTEIPKQLKKLRPSVSNRKIKQRTKAAMKRFNSWHLVCKK